MRMRTRTLITSFLIAAVVLGEGFVLGVSAGCVSSGAAIAACCCGPEACARTDEGGPGLNATCCDLKSAPGQAEGTPIPARTVKEIQSAELSPLSPLTGLLDTSARHQDSRTIDFTPSLSRYTIFCSYLI